MSYIEQNLLPGERVRFRAQLHWIYVLLPLLSTGLALVVIGWFMIQVNRNSPADAAGVFNCAAFLILMAVLAVGLSKFGAALVNYLTTELVVTDQRILAKQGWIRRHTLEMPFQHIESIGVNQGLGGRLLDYGTLVVSGSGGTCEVFPAVRAPLTFRQHLMAQVHAQTQAEPPSSPSPNRAL